MEPHGTALIWLQHRHHQNVTLTHGEIWAVSLVAIIGYRFWGGYIASQCLVSLSLLRGPYRFPVFRAHLWQKTHSILKWSSAILTVTHINMSNILHHDHMLHCCPNGSQLVPTGPNGSHLCLSSPTEDCPGTKSIIQPGCANKAAGMATTALDEECLSIVIPCFTCDDKLQLYRFKTLLSRWS